MHGGARRNVVHTPHLGVGRMHITAATNSTRNNTCGTAIVAKPHKKRIETRLGCYVCTNSWCNGSHAHAQKVSTVPRLRTTCLRGYGVILINHFAKSQALEHVPFSRLVGPGHKQVHAYISMNSLSIRLHHNRSTTHGRVPCHLSAT